MYEDAIFGLLDTSRRLTGYTSWQHATRDLHICLHSATLQRLSICALKGLKSEGSTEIGGILWGKFSRGLNGIQAIIENAEFVGSETALYNSTAKDYQALVRALTRRTAHTEQIAIGYFRSHVRDGLYLSHEDTEFIKQNMRDPNSIFLLVRPFDMGMCMAGFFFWENGALQVQESEFEVPFLASEDRFADNGSNKADDSPEESRLPTGDCVGNTNEVSPTMPISQASFTHSTTAGSAPVIQAPRTLVHTKRRHAKADRQHRQLPGASIETRGPSKSHKTYRLTGTVVIAFLVLAFMAASAYVALPALRAYLLAGPSYSSSAQLGLSVIRVTDGQLDISWNRNAPELLKAEHARITIADGPVYKEVDINSSQLRLGKLTYFPSSPDMEFRLEVYLDSKRSVAESVRVISSNVATAARKPISHQEDSTKVALPLANSPPSAMGNRSGIEIPDQTQSKSRRRFSASGLAPVPLRTSQRTITFRNETQPPNVPLFLPELASSSWSVLPGLISASPPVLPPPIVKSANSIAVGGLPDAINRSASAPQDVQASAGRLVSPSDSPLTTTAARPINRAYVPQSRSLANSSPVPSAVTNVTTYVPPRAVKKILPTAISLPHSPIYDDIRIEIKVSINAAGRVTDAHIVKNGDRVDSLIAGSAILAAKQWIFEPAKMHGKPIAADHTIVFEFHPPSQ